jgi:hypothetical protein
LDALAKTQAAIPEARITSPTLRTFAAGSHFGSGNTSASQVSREAPSMGRVFSKCVELVIDELHTALAAAVDCGMKPPFATITSVFSAMPMAITRQARDARTLRNTAASSRKRVATQAH